MYLSRRYILIKLLVVILFSNNVSCRTQDKLPPEILAAEVEYNVRLNDTICLPCAFKVQYKGEYRILSYWQKSKSPVLSWPRYTLKTDCLEIKNIRSVDHGKYTCIAENKLGKTSAVRRLNVLNRIPGKLPEPEATLKPSITKFPIPNLFYGFIRVDVPLVRKTASIGERVKLRCQIKGSPEPRIYWLRNGKVVEKSDKYSTRPRKKLLVIRNFSNKEAGRYTCVGNNSDGVRNMTFVVEAKEEFRTNPPTTTTDPPQEISEITVRPGETITLTCQAPVKKLTYLLWSYIERSKKRRARQHERKNVFKTKRFLETKVIENDTRVQQYTLVNISKSIHEGEYHCIGLFRKKSVKVVKMVKLKVEEPKDLPFVDDVQTDSSSSEEFPLNIVIPAAGVAFFLLVIFLCVCFVCRRKAQNTKGLLLTVPAQAASPHQQQNLPEQDGDEQLFMQILPVCNYDSLRKHTPKSSTYELRADSLKSNSSVKCHLVTSTCENGGRKSSSDLSDMSINFSDPNLCRNKQKCSKKQLKTSCKNNPSLNSNSLERRDSNLCTNRNDDETTLSCSKPEVTQSSNNLWPGERLDPNDPQYMEFIDEKDRLLMKEYPTIERTKKCKIENNPMKNEITDSDKSKCRASLTKCDIHNGSLRCGNSKKPLSIDSEEKEEVT